MAVATAAMETVPIGSLPKAIVVEFTAPRVTIATCGDRSWSAELVARAPLEHEGRRPSGRSLLRSPQVQRAS